jgi:hypothetical protein
LRATLAQHQQLVYIDSMKTIFRLLAPILTSLILRKLLRRTRK